MIGSLSGDGRAREETRMREQYSRSAGSPDAGVTSYRHSRKTEFRVEVLGPNLDLP